MPVSLDHICTFPALVDYLRDELEWPIPENISLDEATYDVAPEEIGLKSEVIGGGIEIKQLRPLTRAQPWGVFFLNLPNAKLPITLVRNILGKLAVKKRASANPSERAAFNKSDLMFITATGGADDRRLAFAHFADDRGLGDAATLKVLGWDADDTPRRLELTEQALKAKLQWPSHPADLDQWRAQWSGAFTQTPGQVVRDSKAMAKALAALARRIRERAKELIAAQTEAGSLVQLHKAFKEALINDLTPEGFADTYAQTIAYGLLSTAISRASGALVQEDMTANVAGTSPFLKEMLGAFIEAGGRRTGVAKAGLDFDELGITDVVDLLRDAKMDEVLADFDRNNPDEDPVIHFYELFLNEYDAAQKVKRGVFYTPRPVVGFIVRSVNEVLRTEFGLADGLASTATWDKVLAAKPEIKLPVGVKSTDPFVRILDPATGTGTFLVECVDVIHKTMVAKWEAAGRKKEIKSLWNEYVPRHLLPRLTGFELMMAPYAIAHVKIGLKLFDTGYRFGGDARAQIYLTNALEPAQDFGMQLAFMSAALAHEARAANAAKETRFTVVIGNPPYSVSSLNRGPWIEGLLGDFKKHLEGEKNLQPLSDDYLKFFRVGIFQIEKSGCGILTFIANREYLPGVLHRSFRRYLLSAFGLIICTDLGGQAGILQNDAPDENVFEIKKGVSIALFVKSGKRTGSFYRRIIGSRAEKYSILNGSAKLPNLCEVTPAKPRYDFMPPTEVPNLEYRDFCAIPAIFLSSPTTGFATHRDHFAIALDKEELERRIQHFCDRTYSDEQICKKFELSDTRDWKLKKARNAVAADAFSASRYLLFDYRPFDERWVYYSDDVLEYSRRSTMENVGTNSLALVCSQIAKDEAFNHVFVSQRPIEKIFLSAKSSNNAQILLSYKRSTVGSKELRSNITPAFAQCVASLTRLNWDDCVEEPRQAALAGILPLKPEQTALFATRRERGDKGKSFGPRDLFDWIYAVLHSPVYRQRYADYLKSDFARVPLPASRELFETLVPLGAELVALHLLDAGAVPILADPKSVRLAGHGEARVAHAPTFDANLGRVTISPSRWFEAVPDAAWSFHVGGYQPAQKWLKDRAAKGGKKASAGRVLTADDVLHYRRIIVALTRTAEIMSEIDRAIDAHGGWPGAFKGMTDA